MLELAVALAVFLAQEPAELKVTLSDPVIADAGERIDLPLFGETESYSPVIFSRDGKRLLYFQSSGKTRNDPATDVVMWGVDGKDRRVVCRSDAGALNAVVATASMFSRDGKRIAVIVAKARREGGPPDLRPAFSDLDGHVTEVPGAGETTGCTFAGDAVAWLEPSAGQAGYVLKIWDGKSTNVLHESGTGSAMMLCASPDGARLAFLVQEDRGTHLRVLDAKTKAVADSAPFEARGLLSKEDWPHVHWSADGKSVYYNAFADQRSFRLSCLDAEKGKSGPLLDEKNVGVIAVLDRDHLLVHRKPEGAVESSAILRLDDRKLFPLPRHLAFLGGAGRHAYVLETQKGSPFPIPRIAQIDLPR